MIDKLINNIKQIENLSPEEERAFLEVATLKKVDKKEFLFKEAEACNQTYFIASGCIRVFSNVDGEEKTIQFFFEDNWYAPNPGENIQAIEPCVVYQFSKSSMGEFFSKYPKAQKIGLVLTQQGIECSHGRVRKLMIMSPEELYMDLLSNNPEIVQRIPQKHVASYLNIKPESLSRIKRRIFSG